MSESAVGVMVLGAVATVAGVVWHAFLTRYLLASFAAALTGSVLFQILATIHLGYLDPLFLIAFFFSTVICFGLSLMIGLPFWLVRSGKIRI